MRIKKSLLRKIIREVVLSEIVGSKGLGAGGSGSYSYSSSGGQEFDDDGEDEESTSTGTGKIIIFGDSQSGGNIGKSLRSAYSGRILGEIQTQNGSGVRYWTSRSGWKRIQSIVDEEGCPSAFLILLGGNPDGATDPVSLVDKIGEACPDAKVHWSGAPPSMQNTAARSKRNKEIRDAISSDATFYDPSGSMTAEQVGNTAYPSEKLANKYVQEQLRGIV